MVQGVMPALLTPFSAGGKEVDVARLKGLADHLVGSKVAGLFVTGTTGEFVSLTPEERRLVIKEVLQHAGTKTTVIIHVGSFNTQESVALTRFSKDHGAAAVGCMPPYFYTLDEDALYTHFARICEAAGELPVFLYNIPGTAINEISYDNIEKLTSAFPNIRGIKESSGDMERERHMIGMGLPDFVVINGCDEETLTALRMGVRATVSSTANAFPEAFTAVYDAFLAGDEAKAEAEHARLVGLTEVLGHGRTLHGYKLALAWKGVDVGTVRPPHRELTAAEQDRLKAALQENGWI